MKYKTYEIKAETEEMKRYRNSTKMAKEVRTSVQGVINYTQKEKKQMGKTEKKALLKPRGRIVEGENNYLIGRCLGYKYK